MCTSVVINKYLHCENIKTISYVNEKQYTNKNSGYDYFLVNLSSK